VAKQAIAIGTGSFVNCCDHSWLRRLRARSGWMASRYATGGERGANRRVGRAQVLHERESGDDHLRGAVDTQPAHRSQSVFE